MIRFKSPYREVNGEDDLERARRIIHETQAKRYYCGLKKLAERADRLRILRDMDELDRQMRHVRTHGIPDSLVDWEEVGRLASRIAREAKKLKAKAALRDCERRNIEAGIATRVRRGR